MIRKQLQWNESTDFWPITDASAIHYTYNPTDSNKIVNPAIGTSYGLDQFLNGLQSRFLTTSDIVGIATNINKGTGVLYNSASNTTAVAIPSAGASNNFVKVTYTNAGVFTVTFDPNTYLVSSTKYAASASVGGDATRAVDITGGIAGNLLYLNAANDTTFLSNPSSTAYFLGWSANSTSGIPQWRTIENYGTTTLVTSKALSLTNGSWTESTGTYPTTAGTYAIYIEDSSYGAYSGMFTVKGTAGKLEEIPLHWCTPASTTADSYRIYAATLSGKILLSCTSSSALSHTVTIKYKRII